MGEEIYVMLDACIPAEDGSKGSNVLGRRVDIEYVGKPFRDIIQKMLDPEPDAYNQTPYNAGERVIAQEVGNWFSEMNADPSQVQVDVLAVTNDQPKQDIPVQLDERVSEYSDRIIQQVEEDDDSGQTVTISLIELSVAKNTPGGNSLDSICDYRG